MLPPSVQIRIPGTTSNLGPGYDCLGVALALYNVVEVARGGSSDQPPMVAKAADVFFRSSGLQPFDFTWSIAGDVPRSRGLGSSVTVRLGLIAGLNELAGQPLALQQMFELCAGLEGHPDNAAPAAFGGFTLVRGGGKVLRFPVEERLQFVLLIPDFEIETASAREVLPATLPLRDAVGAIGNACAITAAFAARDYEKLSGAFVDFVHQPYRTPLIAFLPKVIAAAEKAGALGAFLSGSGSTICAVTLSAADEVAGAMAAAADLAVERTRILRADHHGLRTLETCPA